MPEIVMMQQYFWKNIENIFPSETRVIEGVTVEYFEIGDSAFSLSDRSMKHHLPITN